MFRLVVPEVRFARRAIHGALADCWASGHGVPCRAARVAGWGAAASAPTSHAASPVGGAGNPPPGPLPRREGPEMRSISSSCVRSCRASSRCASSEVTSTCPSDGITRGRASSGTQPTASSRDTIYALASGSGKSGVAVVRISGPIAGVPLDKAVVLRFPSPRSLTGEDVVELHLHGSPAVIRAVLEALGTFPGMRHAKPGEFVKRSFQAGKLDLVQLESMADLLSAETEAQRLQALKAMEGSHSSVFAGWRHELLSCLASVEAVLDFGEDAELGSDVAAGIIPRAIALRQAMEQGLEDGHRGEMIRSGVRMVLMGPPNAGKSSILNLMAGRPAAIVSPHPGTTRDVVECPLDLGGYKVLLSDSAGIREALDPIEMEGISRALAAAREADVVIFVLDISSLSGLSQAEATATTRDLRGAMASLGYGEANSSSGGAKPALLIINKIDLLDSSQPPSTSVADIASSVQSEFQDIAGLDALLLSCATAEGAEELQQKLTDLTGQLMRSSLANSQDAALVTRHRHRQLLQDCVGALHRYEEVSSELELAAEELRTAARALGSITGTIETEEILETIFSEFCIGK